MKLVLKKKKKKFLCKLIILFVISIISSVLFIKFYSEKTAPMVINYSEDEIRRLILLVINNSIGESTDKVDTNELFIVRYNDKGEIILIDFDSKKSSFVFNLDSTRTFIFSCKDITLLSRARKASLGDLNILCIPEVLGLS